MVLRTEFKVALNAYLSALADENRVSSLSELIHFNEQNPREVMPYFKQEQFLASEATHGLDDLKYKKALDLGIDIISSDKLVKLLSKFH